MAGITIRPPKACVSNGNIDYNKWSLKVSDVGDVDLTKEITRFRRALTLKDEKTPTLSVGMSDEEFNRLVDLTVDSGDVELPKDKQLLIKLNRSVKYSLNKLKRNETSIDNFSKELDRRMMDIGNGKDEDAKLRSLAGELRKMVGVQNKLAKVPLHANSNLVKVIKKHSK